MLDSYQRQVRYLRLSVTDRCNLRCRYCMPEEGTTKLQHSDILNYDEITQLVTELAQNGIDKVRLTGGEPLIRKDIVTLVKRLRAVPGIHELVMTTNGLLLKEYAKALKEAGLNRINLSLDTLKNERFEAITRGGQLAQVLEGIEAAKTYGLLPLKINVVLMGGFNDDEIEDFVALTQDEAIDIRFIELMPMGEAKHWSKAHFIPCEIVLEKVKALKLDTVQEIGSPATYYRLPHGVGRVGLIRPMSCQFCQSCNRIRVTAEGKLKTCLHSDTEWDLKPLLKDKGSVMSIVETALSEKPKSHGLNEGKYIKRNMISIGG
jgi:GTP 3',8-cyclase